MTNSTTVQKLSDKEAAALIRTHLKEKFPGVKFSVRSSTTAGLGVEVEWIDGPTKPQVEKEIGMFRGSAFDGMDDSIKRVNGPFEYKGQTYSTYCQLFIYRHYSAKRWEEATNEIASKYFGGTGAPQFKIHEYDGRAHLEEVNGTHSIDDWLTFTRLSREKLDREDYSPIARSSRDTTTRSSVTMITVTENEEKDGVEIRFPDKPDERVRDRLKANRFRWSRYSECWFAKRTPESLAFARSFLSANPPAGSPPPPSIVPEKTEPPAPKADDPLTPEERAKVKELLDLAKNTPGYFPTPDRIAHYLVDLARLEPGDQVWEPQAGDGHLALVLLDRCPKIGLHCIERNGYLCDILKILSRNRQRFLAFHENFLRLPPGGILRSNPPDVIVSNPPWGNAVSEDNRDYHHVKLAYELARKRVVSLVHPGISFHDRNPYKEFREWVYSVGGEIITTMPDGSPIRFDRKESGTDCAAAIVVIEKDYSPSLTRAEPEKHVSPPVTRPPAPDLSDLDPDLLSFILECIDDA